MFDPVLKSIAYLLFVAMIVTVGWREPLSKRFFPLGKTSDSSDPTAQLAPQPAPPKRGLLRSSLDYGPYRVKNGIVKFLNSHDPRALGNPATAEERYPRPVGAQAITPLNEAETLRD